MLKEVIKLIITYIIRVVLIPFSLFPIKKNRVMFVSLTGGSYMEYTCNPKYVYEELQRYVQQKQIGSYDIIWAFAEPEKYTFLKTQGVKLVKHFTIKAIYYLMTSKVVITGGSYLPWIHFRKKQVVIDTWHGGGAYKSLERGQGLQKKLIDKRNALAGNHATVFVSCCKKFTEFVICDAFGFKGEVLEIGLPRNDFLVKKETEYATKKIRQQYKIDEKVSILLYAPTYREVGCYDKLDMQQVRQCLEKATGKEWVCFLRGHRYEIEKIGNAGESIIDVSDYSDMQELLAAADMLITDYSSCVWDYALLDRPCYLYTPDLGEYRKNRGFYVDVADWYIPYDETVEGLMKQIEDVDNIDWKVQMKKHLESLGSCETGRASEVIVNYIEKACSAI